MGDNIKKKKNEATAGLVHCLTFYFEMISDREKAAQIAQRIPTYSSSK